MHVCMCFVGTLVEGVAFATHAVKNRCPHLQAVNAAECTSVRNRSSCVACLPTRLHQGSERVLRTEVSGQRLKEAQSINKSVVLEICGVGGLRVGGGAHVALTQ